MENKHKQNEFLKLLEPINKQLNGYIKAVTRNSEDTKDIVSEAILISYENFDKIQKKDSFKAYIFSVARRIYKRKMWRNRIFGKFDDHSIQNIIIHETSPDAQLEIQFLYKELNKLPLKQKEAVILFEISGFSIEEISELQGGTISGVKSRLKRGRETLSRIMNEVIINSSDFNYTTKLNGTSYQNSKYNIIQSIDNKIEVKS